MRPFTKSSNHMLLIGVWVNRNWILGNWIKEVRLRHPKNFRLWWIPSIYSGKRKWEKFVQAPIPKADAYFFSYPTIFKFYSKKNPKKFTNNSLILYPHSEPEMGTMDEQVNLLNQAFKIYFYCKQDADKLISHGLIREKAVIANCAVDNDCVIDINLVRDSRSIVLASRFGPRKGAELLPELIKRLPNWNFTIMGRGWTSFIQKENLVNLPNFNYVKFNKKNRSTYFSMAKIFLSLSNLEGGPVPLIESMSLGVIPISTSTGFAPEFIRDGINGYLLPVNPTTDLIESRINSIGNLTQAPEAAVLHLTWDRIAKLTYSDLLNIKDGS